MCYHERIWLDECPLSFKPVFYRRYIDDTFMLFKDPSHVDSFLDYVNSRHSNIRFTCERESENKLNFLDIEVQRSEIFSTSVYRKSTFSGLGLSFFSFCSQNFKICSIKTLLYRAYRISSSYFKLHQEFNFLKKFLFLMVILSF